MSRETASSAARRDLDARLYVVKLVARVALGLDWIFEGLGPKLLAVSPNEVELVRRSGLAVVSPERTLNLLGVLEILAGVWLLSGWAERWSVSVVTVVMCVLVVAVVTTEPSALANPFGGITKNVCLLACAYVVWALSPLARRGGGASDR